MKVPVLIAILIIGSTAPGRSAATQENSPSERAFSSTIQALLFLGGQHPAHSSLNPDNAFLNMPRSVIEVRLRPNFFFETKSISGVFKPRATGSYAQWEDGAARGEAASESRAYVNEWRVQAQAHPALFASFGKEKMLWGNSFLVSPSNVLFQDTEKANPTTEVEGKYLARLMLLPSNAITITAINETQKEENARGEAEDPIRALKVELTGDSAQTGLVAYQQRHNRLRLGGYGQWTASDAVMLYFDGLISKGSDGLYPELDSRQPLGGALVEKYDGSSRVFTVLTAGGSYTFLTGETVSAEFLYNGAGYNDREASDYYQLRSAAGALLFDAGALGVVSRKVLFESLVRSSDFLRRHYLMAQVHAQELGNAADLMLRYVHSLEERSGQASTILEWRLSDRLRFFNINTVAVGGRNTEFSSLVSRSYLAGLELSL